MKIIYVLNKTVRNILGVWLTLILVIVLISQTKRLTCIYKEEVRTDELSCELEHFDEQTYTYYEEEPAEEEWEGAVICIGDKKTHWNRKQIETLPEDHRVSTGMDVLTITLPSKSIIFRKDTVSYVKYSCLGESSFTNEEIEYYKKAAATKFTYKRHLKLRLKDAAAYKQFIPNENMD